MPPPADPQATTPAGPATPPSAGQETSSAAGPESPQPAGPATPQPDADSGKSKERTRLSWRRTTLTATAVTLLLVRIAILERHWAVAAVAALIWVALLAFVQRRIQVLHDPPRLRFRLLALTSLGGLSFAALGVVVVLL